MKVVINRTEEVTDLQRSRLADVLDDRETKRLATRQEFREWIWQHGASWEAVLLDAWVSADSDDGAPWEAVVPDDADLIGDQLDDLI